MHPPTFYRFGSCWPVLGLYYSGVIGTFYISVSLFFLSFSFLCKLGNIYQASQSFNDRDLKKVIEKIFGWKDKIPSFKNVNQETFLFLQIFYVFLVTVPVL